MTPSTVEALVARARATGDGTLSDLHVEPSQVPWQRTNGRMSAVGDQIVTSDDVRAFCHAYLSKPECERLHGPAGSGDGAIQHPIWGAVRIHAFRTERGIALSLRLLRDDIPNVADLGLPPVVERFVDFPSGLVLFTGPTGSGKSTALAALIDRINRSQARHVITLEAPIEYRHASGRSLVRQCEIGRDVESYREALRGALRADPDVILIGELRDPEVMSACLSASETGHLVFSTLHTSEAAETMARIVGVFEGGRQEQARMQLAHALRAIVSLRLVPLASGTGRRPACEVLLNTPAVRAQLLDPEKTAQIRNTIETSRRDGMQTLEMDLTRLVREGAITYEAAVSASDHPEQIRSLGAHAS